jgi:hypothetical protein
VGQDKDALSLVRRANFTRAKYSPRHLVTQASQFCNDLSESEADVSFDVFKHADSGSKNPNAICDEGPEMAGIFCSESLSGCAKRLAGVASSKDVHSVTKL